MQGKFFCSLAAAALVAGVILLAPSSANAAIGTGNGEFGIDLGVTQFDDNVSDDAGLRFGVRGGYHFSDLFELEAQFTTQDTEEGPDDLVLSTLFANGVFNFHPSESVVPYFLVGVGTANLEVETFDFLFDDDSVAYQAAVGSRFFFRQRALALRVELSAMREETFDEGSTHIGLTGGLTWRVGGPRR